ncbi:hypothetical protein [Streptomyces sp. NPDC048659]|uniref:hypothetical protein n=1 Tax=Streptomyces sp. NPDC048659 TaxID=3155489 RepID=UPI003445FB0C
MNPDSCLPHTRASVPAPCGVPAFDPLRVRGGRLRLRRALQRRRLAPAAVLALTAATLAAAGAAGADDLAAPPPPRPPAQERHRPPVLPLVSAPVRIADAETVRLLRPGDRVDVIAAPGMSPGAAGRSGEARVVASGVRVADVPDPGGTPSDGGALVVLSVPRSTAAELAGAGMTSQLAVTVC